MKVDARTRKLLKKHGFQWYKNGCTDRLEANCIKDIIPAADGFTVVYNEKSIFDYSTVTVKKIDIPANVFEQWIQVYWDNIIDERRE